jgi:arginyl-tRNA synthetase
MALQPISLRYAYHYNKFIERNFDRVNDIWGADHQGQVFQNGPLSVRWNRPEAFKGHHFTIVTMKRARTRQTIQAQRGYDNVSEVVERWE